MRMEELTNNQFKKDTDSVERYLLNIVQNYFNNSGITSEDSREYIIQKAVERMKDELFIDNAGVVSLNGKTGVLSLTLSDLGGEPQISPKLSAFNVDFGNTENTACKGNDTRLSDKRKPLSHTHEITDINGLSGKLSEINGNIDLLNNKTHKHDNKEVLDKLTYSGSNTEIDLTLLDTAAKSIQDKTTEVDTSLANIKTQLDSYTSQVNTTYNQYQTDYNNTIAGIDTKDTAIKTETENYCNTSLTAEDTTVQTALNNKITKEQLNNIINVINTSFTSIYDIDIPNFVTTADPVNTYEAALPTDIITTISGIDNEKYRVDFKIKYTDPATSKQVISTVPYIYAADGHLEVSISASIENNSSIKITSIRFNDTWSSFISNAVISCKISSINNVPEV